MKYYISITLRNDKLTTARIWTYAQTSTFRPHFDILTRFSNT